MAQFEVTTRELRKVASDLEANNQEFRNRISELQEAQQELAGKWEGEANVAFTNAFNNDKAQWDKFSSLIDRYLQTLQQIANEYEKKENMNVEIATKRSC